MRLTSNIVEVQVLTQKLTSRSKKEMGSFIHAKLTVITWEQPLRKL